jgi:hypothetical protein
MASHPAFADAALLTTLDEAAAALDSLTARVKELEAEAADWFKTAAKNDARATRAEQQRDEAVRDAERYRFLRGRDLDTIHTGGVFAGMTPKNVVLNEDDLDREVDAAIRALNTSGNTEGSKSRSI